MALVLVFYGRFLKKNNTNAAKDIQFREQLQLKVCQRDHLNPFITIGTGEGLCGEEITINLTHSAKHENYRISLQKQLQSHI